MRGRVLGCSRFEKEPMSYSAVSPQRGKADVQGLGTWSIMGRGCLDAAVVSPSVTTIAGQSRGHK